MNTREKLNLMQEIKATNEARIREFVEAGKTMKTWKVDFAFVVDDEQVVEDHFDTAAPTIVEAVTIATELLTTVAPSMGWKRWMIWNIGVYEDDLF